MDELLKRASMYEYDDDGSVPVNILQNKDQRTHPYTFDKGGNVTWADNTEVEQHLTTKGEPKQQNNGITLYWFGSASRMNLLFQFFTCASSDAESNRLRKG